METIYNFNFLALQTIFVGIEFIESEPKFLLMLLNVVHKFSQGQVVTLVNVGILNDFL